MKIQYTTKEDVLDSCTAHLEALEEKIHEQETEWVRGMLGYRHLYQMGASPHAVSLQIKKMTEAKAGYENFSTKRHHVLNELKMLSALTDEEWERAFQEFANG